MWPIGGVMVRKWSSAFVKLCVGITVTSTAPPRFPKFYPKQLPHDAIITFPTTFSPSHPSHVPPTRTHTHAHIECCTKGGRTTVWLQLHKHNFWQHYYTLEPTVFFIFTFYRESPYSCFCRHVASRLTHWYNFTVDWMDGLVHLLHPLSPYEENGLDEADMEQCDDWRNRPKLQQNKNNRRKKGSNIHLIPKRWDLFTRNMLLHKSSVVCRPFWICCYNSGQALL